MRRQILKTKFCTSTTAVQRRESFFKGDMYNSLQNGIKKYKQGIGFFTENTINSFDYVELISAESQTKSLKSENLIMDQDKGKLEDFFWSLESFLIYLTKDKKLEEYRRKLLNRIQSRECLFSGIRRKKRYSRKIKKCLDSNSKISNVEVCVVGKNQTLSHTDSCAGPHEQKAQNNTQNTILFEGETNYEASSPVKKKEKQISIDVFEDIELSAFFSCDSSNDEFTNGKEEHDSLDRVVDMSASDPPVEANQDDNKTSIDNKVNTSSFKTFPSNSSKDSKTKLSHCEETIANNADVQNEWNLNEVFNISQDPFIDTEIKDLEIGDNEKISNILIKKLMKF
ncbi:hypothetical protein TNIN_181911 [Trichonephila inaurata madagascariensis]|uniref:Uncharacterized protein n=1 Tax=Trichonephila inaurata madagascariensis TaxID=2747483 RepID=A0A8X7CA14_9ARAC|nr:hypothetical protein TNIN_181911 [Trichonephila inaurata madagascariensis]